MDETLEKVVAAGKKKARLSVLRMILFGVLAGAFIALAGVGATFGNVYAGKIAGALIFPAGLAMVVVAGSELFTGNNLMMMAMLRGEISVCEMLKNWGFVYLGNLIGVLIVSAFVVGGGVLDAVAETVVATANAKAGLDFLEAILRGVLCNFLVCVAVWMAFSANTVSGKILAVFFPVMLFVLCGFEHSVANMFYVPAGMMEGARMGMLTPTVAEFLVGNLLPVTIGNIIGGAGCVGVAYYLALQTGVDIDKKA